MNLTPDDSMFKSSGVFYFIWSGMQVAKARDCKSLLYELGCTSGSFNFGGSNPPLSTTIWVGMQVVKANGL